MHFGAPNRPAMNVEMSIALYIVVKLLSRTQPLVVGTRIHIGVTAF